MGRAFIPYSCQDVNDDDIQAVTDILRSSMITQGPAIEQFEADIAEYSGAPHVVAVASGTAALHSACAALGVQTGSRVWTSPNSFVASSNAALYLGAEVDFVDIDPATGNMDPGILEAKLEQAAATDTLPDVLIPVHFAGRPCDMQRISALCQRYSIRIIEDAAHALGASYACGKKVGSCAYSDATIFSFHPVKPITTGEGGAVVTNKAEVAEFVRQFRSHGISRDAAHLTHQTDQDGAWYYEQHMLGYHYRMTDIQAALGSSQLRRLDAFTNRRHQVVGRYAELLSDVPVTLPPASEGSAWHLYSVQLDLDKHSRKAVFDALRAADIGVNVHYIPIHLQPYYRGLGFKAGDFPNAEQFSARVLSLPIFPALTPDDQAYVAQQLAEALHA